MRLRLLVPLVLASFMASVLVFPAVTAHPIRAPCAWENRLLHDHEDDLGDSTVQAKHGHELHGLDLVEAWDESMGDVLIFRLSYEGGYSKSNLAPEKPDRLKDVLSFQAGGTTKTFEWTTTNNAAFSGTFNKVVQPEDLTTACDSTQVDEGHHGDRQVVEGWISLSKNGIQKGAVLSKFKVESFADSTKADTMGEGTAKDGDSAWFKIAQYEVGARPRIVDARLDWETVDMKVGQNKTVVVTFDNLVDRVMDARVVYDGPDGTKGTFHLNDDIGYQTDVMAWQQAEDSEASIHLYLQPTEPVNGAMVTVEAYGDMGPYTGRAQRSLTLNVAAADAAGNTEEAPPTADASVSESPAEEGQREAPGIAPSLFMIGVAALASIIRRKD